MSNIRFEYQLVPIITEKLGNVLIELSDALMLCSSVMTSVEAGYAGEASPDISIFFGTLAEHLNALIKLYGTALSMAMGVASETHALEDWLAAEGSKLADETYSKFQSLESEANGA